MADSETSGKKPVIEYIRYGEMAYYDPDDIVTTKNDDDFVPYQDPTWILSDRPHHTTLRVHDEPSEANPNVGVGLHSCGNVSTVLLVALASLGLLFGLMGFVEAVFAKRRSHRHCLMHIYIASMGCIVHIPVLRATTISSELDEDRALLRIMYFTSTAAQTSCIYQLLHLLAVRSEGMVARLKHSGRVMKINCFVIILVSLGFGTVGAFVPPHSKGSRDFWHEGRFIMTIFAFTFLLPIMMSIGLIIYSKYRKVVTRSSEPTNNRSGETDAIMEDATQNPEQITPKITMQVTKKTFLEASVLFFGYVVCWAPLKILQLYYQRAQEFHGCKVAVDVALMVACLFSIAMPMLHAAFRPKKRKPSSYRLQDAATRTPPLVQSVV